MIINFSASIIPSNEANSLQVIKTSDAIMDKGEEVILFSRNSKNRENVKQFYNINNDINIYKSVRPNIPIVGGIIYAIINNYKLKKIIESKNREIRIYGRDVYSLLLSLALPFKKKLVYESHMIPTNQIKYRLEKVLFQNASFKALITTSNSLKDGYIKLFGIEENKIHVVNNGADRKSYSQNLSLDKKSENYRKSILYVGSLKKGKGIEFVISLANRLKNIDFKIAGGNQNDIETLRKIHDIPSNMKFYGFVKQSEMADVYSDSDICLAPYTKETISFKNTSVPRYPSPLKIIEYMSYGKAIIASNLTMSQETLIDRKNSLLCEPNVVDDWINAINALINDNVLFESISKQALNDFNNNLSWDIRAAKILKIFEEYK